MIALGSFAALFLIVWGFATFAFPPVIAGVRKLAARVASVSPNVQMPWYWPVAAIIVAGLVLATWAGDGFFDIAESVRSNSPIGQRFDHATYDWLRAHRDPADTRFFVAATMVGSPVGMGLVVAIVLSVLLVQRRFRWAVYMAGTALGGSVLDEILKRLFVRARPDLNVAVLRARGYSFPSGHAMGSTVVLAALTYLAMRAVDRWPRKTAVLALAVTAVAAIAFSRIYLGVHWISDVGAGIAAGIVWVASTTTAYETVRRLRILRARRNG